MRLVAAVVVVLVFSAGAFGQTVKGDAKAWSEVVAAWDALQALKGFRMRITAPRRPVAVVDVISRTRWRATIHAGFLTVEAVQVGDDTRMKTIGAWKCNASIPAFPSLWPPERGKIQGEVTISRLPNTTLDGTAAQGYDYTFTSMSFGSPVEVRQKVYVTTDTRLPKHLEGSQTAPGAEVGKVDFFDYGASITVTLPPCT